MALLTRKFKCFLNKRILERRGELSNPKAGYLICFNCKKLGYVRADFHISKNDKFKKEKEEKEEESYFCRIGWTWHKW